MIEPLLAPLVLLSVTTPAPRAADHSARRVDVEIVGWNQDYSELATLVVDVTRSATGQQRGEALFVVFPVGATEASQRVQTLYITQAASPDDPLPLPAARDKLTSAANYLPLWPRRAVKPPGGMSVETLWVPVEVEPGLCKPAVGFLLTDKVARRVQPFVGLDWLADCATLRLVDTRLVWAKRDLAAALVGFSASATAQENSYRVPLSVAWPLAREVSLTLFSQWPKDDPATVATLQQLRRFGSVRLVEAARGASPGVRYAPAWESLAHVLAAALSLPPWGVAELGAVDVHVDLMPAESDPAKRSRGHASDTPRSEYLEDWVPP